MYAAHLQTARRWFPECCIVAVALFFALRELGTFPAAWQDSGLYTIVARSFAAGHGYTLPILDERWAYPYFLSVGPTVIVPVGIAIWALGFSLETARMVPVWYLLLATLCFYLFVKRASTTWNARWATALLMTLSAFVNSGKPVLGSVPALFYLLLGMVLWQRMQPTRHRAVLAGVCFGLAALTKITFLLVLPALAVAAVVNMVRRNAEWRGVMLTATVALAVYLPWIALELHQQTGFGAYLVTIFTRASGPNMHAFFAERLGLLLRFQYQYFAVIAALGITGYADRSLRLSATQRMFLLTLAALFTLHFLVREGWYRHVLPAHVLLLCFAPLGLRRIVPRQYVHIPLLVFLFAQFVWQLDHKGSPRSTAAAEVAVLLEQQYANADLLIQHTEVFVRLPENPHWLFQPLESTEEDIPPAFTELTPEQRCFATIRKMSQAEAAASPHRARDLPGNYVLLEPPAGCPTFSQ